MKLFGSSHEAAEETFPITHTDAEWRAKLSPAQYSDTISGIALMCFFLRFRQHSGASP